MSTAVAAPILATNKTIIPLSNKDLQDMVPVAFQSEAHPKMSKNYQFVNTSSIIKQLSKAGLKPFRATQLRYRDEKNQNNGYQLHKITFYHPDLVILNTKNQIEEMFEVSITNSHNGYSKFSLFGSFFRLACDNGMLCMSNDMGHLVVRHMGEGLSDLPALLDQLKDQYSLMAKNVKSMKKKSLSDEKMLELATKMAEARHFKQKGKFDYDAKELLKPLRDADKGRSLWKVYNVIQEKLIKGYDFAGGTEASADDKKAARKLRKVNHFQVQMDLNRNFWEIAQSF